MGEVQCFWLEPTGTVQVSLRRYGYASPCPADSIYGSHDVSVPIAVEARTDNAGSREWDHADPRWPVACGCGYTFTEADEWQARNDDLYRRADTGEEYTINDAPVGAMWNAEHLVPHFAGPDGICLMIRTPGGDWGPDMASTQGTPWERTGTPPNITANPSILIYDHGVKSGGYHGWLRDGKLIEV